VTDSNTRWFAAIACCLFILLAAAFIPKAGVQHDEALFAVPLYSLNSNDLSATVFHRQVVLMVMSYVGTLKTLLYWPILATFGVTAWTVRLPMVILGAATLFVFYNLTLRSAGLRAALLGVALLATDPMFLLTDTFDWGPVAVEHFLLVTACLCLVLFNRKTVSGTTSGIYLFLGFFCLGLALWNKAIFLWALAGLVCAGVSVFWREVRQALRARNLALAAAGFVLGALPFEIYNLRHLNATLSSNAHFETANPLGKLVVARDTLDGAGLFGFLTVEEWDEHPKAAGSPLGRASVSIREHFGQHRRSGLSYVFVAALLAVPLWWRSRAARFSLVFLLVTWAAMAITRDAGAAVHHTVLLWPFPHLFLAAALGSLRWPRAIALAGAVLVTMNLLVLNQYLYEFERFGAAGNFTDALFPLSDSLPKTEQPIYVVDWGMLNTLTIFHQGRLTLRAADEFFVTDAPTPFQQHQIDRIFGTPGALFVGHVPEREVNAGIGARLTKAARAAGYQKELIQTVRDSNGRAVFEIFKLRPTAP
jgi:hypothetical protein